MRSFSRSSGVTAGAAAMVVISLITGCGPSGESNDDGAASAPAATSATTESNTAPASDAAEGSAAVASEVTPGQVQERAVSGRTYMVYVPESADSSQPTGLVLALHGLGESPWSMVRRTQNLADEHGVVVAFPGADNPEMSWEFDTDWTYVEDVLVDVEATVAIDPERVYAIGHSQGGSFSTYLTCPLGDRLAAVATNAFLLQHEPSACGEAMPADVVAIIGAADPITTFGGPHIQEQPWWTGGPLPGPWPEEAAEFATSNSCDPTYAESEVAPGVAHHDYTCSEARLEIYVHPKGHIWVGDGPAAQVDGFTSNEAIWGFLEPTTT